MIGAALVAAPRCSRDRWRSRQRRLTSRFALGSTLTDGTHERLFAPPQLLPPVPAQQPRHPRQPPPLMALAGCDSARQHHRSVRGAPAIIARIDRLNDQVSVPRHRRKTGRVRRQPRPPKMPTKMTSPAPRRAHPAEFATSVVGEADRRPASTPGARWSVAVICARVAPDRARHVIASTSRTALAVAITTGGRPSEQQQCDEVPPMPSQTTRSVASGQDQRTDDRCNAAADRRAGRRSVPAASRSALPRRAAHRDTARQMSAPAAGDEGIDARRASKREGAGREGDVPSAVSGKQQPAAPWAATWNWPDASRAAIPLALRFELMTP